MPSRKRSGPKKRELRREMSADEIEAQRATDLPDREVMTLIDPNLLGGALTGAMPTGPQAPVPAPSPDGAPVQATGGSLLDRFMPKAAEGAAGQPYQPSTEQTANS
jgi:hypothetical protein